MKLPRNVSGRELISAVKPLGYKVVRQLGSHIRLTTRQNGEHHITVPNHDPIKAGTLSYIVGDIATHFNKKQGRYSKNALGMKFRLPFSCQF